MEILELEGDWLNKFKDNMNNICRGKLYFKRTIKVQ